MKLFTCLRTPGLCLLLAFTASSLFAQTQPTPTTTVDNEYQIGAILFHQKAAEYRALTYQAFNIARLHLDADKKTRKKLPKSERSKPMAIIVDSDETVMDNSRYFAGLAKRGEAQTTPGFLAWNESMQAKPVPGAVEFLQYASSRGVEIFYVSNRSASFQETTVANLKNAGFPNADNEHVLLISDTSSKEPRRQRVFSSHRVLMLIGDNLNDFSNVFEGKPVDDRFLTVDQNKEKFGTRFIIVPNIMYGAWESAIYGPGRKSDQEKKASRHENLVVFEQ